MDKALISFIVFVVLAWTTDVVSSQPRIVCPPCEAHEYCYYPGTTRSHCEKSPPDLKTLDEPVEVEFGNKTFIIAPKSQVYLK